MGHDLQQNVLGRVLCIMERAQHPQGQIEYQIGISSPESITAISLGIFFLIYAIYILLAYTTHRSLNCASVTGWAVFAA